MSTKITPVHSCGDSALKCIDCNEPVCPKCFVQCAAGNRRKKCAGRFTSHVLQVPPAILLKTLSYTAFLGFAFGYVNSGLTGMGFGFYSYLILLGLSYMVGKSVHRVAGYKLGPKIVVTILAGLFLGMALGPLRQELLTALSLSQAIGEDQAVGQSMMQSHCIHIFLFALGILLPVLRK